MLGYVYVAHEEGAGSTRENDDDVGSDCDHYWQTIRLATVTKRSYCVLNAIIQLLYWTKRGDTAK
eukprot:scaffold45579_cov197-Skeletonema_marinoi.AAC.4